MRYSARLTTSSLSTKQKEWAKLVRENFFRAGLDEVAYWKDSLRNNLNKRQARTCSTNPPLNLMRIRHVLELAGHSTPTQDYGYGVKFSESSRSRTQGETIP